tara:strand:- start:1093 stop:2664 length:1572 start_codon:yes stop_codon:yes gene_type:complete
MSTSLGYNINRNPIAQSFYVDEPRGCYITKVDLFFSAKGSTAPVMLQIRPMVNGYPSTTEIVPSSTVYVNTANVNTSADVSLATNFEFEEPVYLKGLTDYCIVCTTTDPNYQIYIAQIDEYEVGTTASRVNRNPALGSLFYSQNGGTFSPAQHQDLTFVIHRAEFTPGNATVSLKNAPIPMKLLNVDPITTTASSTTVHIAHEGHGFQVNDPVTILGMDSSITIGGLATTQIMGSKTISAVDWTGYTITAGAAADSDDIGGGVNVKTSKNIPWHVMYLNQQTLMPENTSVATGFKGTTGKSFAGTETAYQKLSDFVALKPNDTIYFDVQHVVANDVIETSELGSNVKSLEMEMSLGTDNKHVAPMVDMQRSSATLINYQIDRQASGVATGFNVPINYVAETNKNSGSSAAKHITRVVKLVEPAVGLKVLLAANKRAGAHFDLYWRACEADDNIYDKDWTLEATTSNNPNATDPYTYHEYEYLIGGTTGTLPEFTNFQLKIVMGTTSTPRAPRFKDLRTIALSV